MIGSFELNICIIAFQITKEKKEFADLIYFYYFLFQH